MMSIIVRLLKAEYAHFIMKNNGKENTKIRKSIQ